MKIYDYNGKRTFAATDCAKRASSGGYVKRI